MSDIQAGKAFIFNHCEEFLQYAVDYSLDDKIRDAKLQLMTILENKQELQYNGTTLVTWKQTKAREYFDKNTFKKEHPDLYSNYVSSREGSRRFTLKKMEL